MPNLNTAFYRKLIEKSFPFCKATYLDHYRSISISPGLEYEHFTLLKLNDMTAGRFYDSHQFNIDNIYSVYVIL